MLLLNIQVCASRAAEEDGRRNDAREHGEGMLKTEKQGEYNGHVIIEAEEGALGIGLFHEWQVWLEEECVVVISDEAFASRERATQCSQACREGVAAWRTD